MIVKKILLFLYFLNMFNKRDRKDRLLVLNIEKYLNQTIIFLL